MMSDIPQPCQKCSYQPTCLTLELPLHEVQQLLVNYSSSMPISQHRRFIETYHELCKIRNESHFLFKQLGIL